MNYFLSEDERRRYQRQIILEGIGEQGQLKLKNASVLVVGAGGLGIPVLQYLAAAGIGKIGIVDADLVEESNLQRQVLFTTAHVGQKKAEVAFRHLMLFNPHIKYVVFPEMISSDNAYDIAADFNVIVDGSDNFQTRYLLNDLCVKTDKPLVSGAINRMEGQVGVFNYELSEGKRSATYRCVFPQPPAAEDAPDCVTAGVLGVLPGLIGMMQATEVIKMITGAGKVLSDKLLLVDARENSFLTLELHRNEKAVNKIKSEALLSSIQYEAFCKSREIIRGDINEMLPVELKRRIKAKEDFQLIDVREPDEHELINIGGELMPVNDIFFHTHIIHKNKPVVLYCKTGTRSEWVIRQLQEKYGFDNLYNLRGGMRAFLSETKSA